MPHYDRQGRLKVVPFSSRDLDACHVWNDGSQNIGGGGWTPLVFDQEEIDTNGLFNNTGSNGTIVIQNAGYYDIGAHIAWDGTMADTGAVGHRIKLVRGATNYFIAEETRKHFSNSSQDKVGISTSRYLEVGDQLTIEVFTSLAEDTAAGTSTLRTNSEFYCYQRADRSLVLSTQDVTIHTGSSVPSNPTDGDLWIYTAEATDGTAWQFRYNASSVSAYKWEFIGGAPRHEVVDSLELLNISGSWQDLATVGPSVTVPFAGDYISRAQAEARNTTSTALHRIFFGVAIGAGTPAFNTGWQIPNWGGGSTEYGNPSIETIHTALSASNELRVRYFSNEPLNSSWRARTLSVIPVRVG